MRQWIRCQAFWDDFWKMKKGDNQSGNSTILGGCRQWNRCKGDAPFQTMAQYYISLGYAGIIYGSTVSKTGKNIVLFDKTTAHPVGAIEDYRIL